MPSMRTPRVLGSVIAAAATLDASNAREWQQVPFENPIYEATQVICRNGDAPFAGSITPSGELTISNCLSKERVEAINKTRATEAKAVQVSIIRQLNAEWGGQEESYTKVKGFSVEPTISSLAAFYSGGRARSFFTFSRGIVQSSPESSLQRIVDTSLRRWPVSKNIRYISA